MPEGPVGPAPSTMIIPVIPDSNRTRSTLAVAKLNRPDADPLGIRRVFAQVAHDLYGTKDVQDAITASYVWMADQIGHLFLGLVPTLILAWLVNSMLPAGWIWIRTTLIVLLAVLMFGYWVYKEFTDFHDTKGRAGPVFPFDSSDIWWNVKTALTYFGIGGIWAVTAFLNGPMLFIVVPLTFWPGLMVAYWWLRRKLAFQQAGLPYLYRLANFKSVMGPDQEPRVEELVRKICNLKGRRVAMWRVLLGRDKVEQHLPIPRHILITGSFGSGKTSLAVGIATEFAFALGIGRYLSAAKLAQLAADAPNMPQSRMEYDDGRVLWPWRQSDLIIVDDVDAGAIAKDGVATYLIRPEDLVAALTIRGPTSLHWLKERRSVWVIGDTAGAAAWKSAICGVLDLSPEEMLVVDLKVTPSPLSNAA